MTNKKSDPKKETNTYIYPDWNAMVEDAVDIYFLKHEVKRLMRANDSLEWRAQLAYAFGWGDNEGGQVFDSKFIVDNISATDNEVFYVNDLEDLNLFDANSLEHRDYEGDDLDIEDESQCD